MGHCIPEGMGKPFNFFKQPDFWIIFYFLLDPLFCSDPVDTVRRFRSALFYQGGTGMGDYRRSAI
jgi:hypothetical protein